MLSRLVILSGFVVSLSCTSLWAGNLSDSVTLNTGQQLQLNGKGTRKKAFIKVYDVGLYLSQASNDAPAIVAADETQAIELVVTSRLATASKISAAFEEGIINSTNNQTEAIAQQMQQFLAVFEQGVVKNDRFQFAYIPDAGTIVSKNSEALSTISGLPFKQALFGIWLSAKPVTEKLKLALLGN